MGKNIYVKTKQKTEEGGRISGFKEQTIKGEKKGRGIMVFKNHI